jgi:hypothetical protein
MTDAPISPLRRRMIENMTVRKFAERTQEAYIRAVKNFSAFRLPRRRPGCCSGTRSSIRRPSTPASPSRRSAMS